MVADAAEMQRSIKSRNLNAAIPEPLSRMLYDVYPGSRLSAALNA